MNLLNRKIPTSMMLDSESTLMLDLLSKKENKSKSMIVRTIIKEHYQEFFNSSRKRI